MFEHLIKPALGSRYAVDRADMMPKTGFITTTVIRRLVEDSLVIADLTDRNPNVYYELALRHSAGKPFVHIAQAETELPFDVQPVATIFYALDDPSALKQALGELKQQVKAIEDEEQPPESPVSVALGGRGPLQRDPAYTWDSVHALVTTLSRRIALDYEPDVVLTTSGPGSIAALLRLAGDYRDTPVVAATAFPKGRAAPEFVRASSSAGDLHVSTDKWDVFIPRVIAELVPNTRVLLFDDRVVSGDFRRAVTAELKERRLGVRGAALIVTPATKDLVEWYCDVRESPYQLPWGDSRGRADE